MPNQPAPALSPASPRTPNRFLIAATGFLVTLCLGTLYAWSVFAPSLEREFGWTRAMVTMPFTVAGLVFAFGMAPAGRFQDLRGPRPLLVISSVLALVGYLASSQARSLPALVASFGVIVGMALASGYSAAVAGGLKWFPDMKGTATGILVGGFGAASAVFGPIAHYLVTGYGWRSAFMILGTSFAVVIGLSSLIITNPPRGWRPAGWDPAKNTGIRKQSPEYTGYEFPLREMLKTRQFWLMWAQYILVLCGGFSIVVHLKLAALDIGMSAAAAAGLVALIGGFNFGGRFIISPMSDLIGRLRSFTIVGAMMMVATAAASLGVLNRAPWLLYTSAVVGGSAFGGYLALSPAFTADMWGMKSVGVNYGAMLTGWGLASFAGPFTAGALHDTLGTYGPVFFVFSFLCIPAILIAQVLVKPAALVEHAAKIGMERTSLGD